MCIECIDFEKMSVLILLKLKMLGYLKYSEVLNYYLRITTLLHLLYLQFIKLELQVQNILGMLSLFLI